MEIIINFIKIKQKKNTISSTNLCYKIYISIINLKFSEKIPIFPKIL